jgi:hypothetical protein
MASNEMDSQVDRIRREMVVRGEVLPALATQPLQIADLTGRRSHMQSIIKSVMRPGIHYGVIYGTKKKSLLKEGSEILLSTFRIAVDPEVEDLSTADVVRYRVRCVGREIGSQMIVGFGLGACSSNEDKYKWRRPVCDEEIADYLAADPKSVRYKWFKGDGKPYKQAQLRTNPEEVANTILKMAKKRAQIDLTQTALAASEAFADDIPKDAPPPRQSNERTGPTDRQLHPPAKTAGTAPSGETPQDTPRPATSSQLGLIAKKLDQAGISETYYLATFEIGRPEQLPFTKVDEALKWIADQMEAP